MSKIQLKISLVWFLLVCTSTLAHQYTRHQNFTIDHPQLVYPLMLIVCLIVGGFMGRKKK